MNLRGPARILGVAAATAFFALCGGGGCGREAAHSEETAEAPAVLVSGADVVTVSEASLASGVSFTGELLPVETVTIVARFDGDLEQVLVREGQAVRRGQTLASYRPRDIEDQLAAAEAQFLAAQAAFHAAENGERRARRLFEAGAAAPRELEAALAQKAAAQAGVDAALALRNHALENAEQLEVPSPIDGRVSQVFVHGGDRTAIGDRLMELVDTSTLELSATVPSEALARVSLGTPIRFHVDAYPGEVFEGRVDRLGPTTEPGTRQVRLYMRLPNPEGRLVGGLFASGRAIDAYHEGATAAPVAVLRTEGTEQVVYRLREGRAQRVAVRMGLLDEESGLVELVGGVAAGDSLLTGVLPGMKDGARVEIVRGSGGNGSGAAAGGTR